MTEPDELQPIIGAAKVEEVTVEELRDKFNDFDLGSAGAFDWISRMYPNGLKIIEGEK